MIHDNGARPFKVVITKNKIAVYKHKPYDGTDDDFDEDDETQYDKCVLCITDYVNVFVGEDWNYPEYKGNNILVHYKQNGNTNKYIMIESEIYSFAIKDEILYFKSPVGNSDVPYSYAIGKKNTYLTSYKSFISNKIVKKECGDTDGNIDEDMEDPYEIADEHYTKYNTKTIIQHYF
jgi:hypothetical protein